MEFLKDWHKDLMAMGVDYWVSLSLAAMAVVAIMAILTDKKKPYTIIAALVSVALTAGALALYHSRHPIWAWLLLALAFVTSLNVTGLSWAQHKAIRFVVGGIATVAVLNSSFLVMGGGATNGDTLSYFLGGNTESVNRLSSTYLLFGVAASVAAVAVARLFWGRKAEKTPPSS